MQLRRYDLCRKELGNKLLPKLNLTSLITLLMLMMCSVLLFLAVTGVVRGWDQEENISSSELSSENR